RPDYESKLQWVCDNILLGEENLYESLSEFPSIQFGIEMAFRSMESENPFVLFPSDFTKGTHSIPINGLVWIGDFNFMKQQIEQKLNQGFSCIKLKIGALNFEKELQLLHENRRKFSANQVEIRVDANGAFSAISALHK